MRICKAIDAAYRRACIEHGRTPTIKHITMHHETFRILIDECRSTAKLSMYSDGAGPHYMGMGVHSAPMPKDLLILQGKDMEVIYATTETKETT